MNKAETSNIVSVIVAAYPNHYKTINADIMQNTIFIWHEILKEYEFNLVQMALKSYIANDTKGFPPAPGQIVGNLRNIQKVGNKEQVMNGIEAWGYLFKALGNSLYNSEEQFNKLPALIQKTVGSPAILKEWASLRLEELQTVTHSNFLRTYNSIVKREEELDCIPNDVKQAIGYKKVEQTLIETKKEEVKQALEKHDLTSDTTERLSKLKSELRR